MEKQAKLRVLISETFDPWFNLATEDWIFRDMDPNYKILFLWRNENTVVIGRFQNPWSECNTEKMERDGIKLARRQSGGGAVFHDLGNTNFTFLSSKETSDKNINNKIITSALNEFSIQAFPSGRNDILVNTADGEKKVSGSAFKETKDRSFHHGTLLINTDMTRLQEYLIPHPKKLQSKGIQSVRARVTNLQHLNTDISHELISEKIIQKFFEYYKSSCAIEILDHKYLETIPELLIHYNRIKDWNWRFGEAPHFSQQMAEYFAWGLVEVHLNAEKGIVSEIKIFSDSLHPEMIEMLMTSLTGISYNKVSFHQAIQNVIIELPMISDYLIEFEEWIIKEIS
jgi:lipoate-protein ligase A